MLGLKPLPEKSLLERIEEIRAEANGFIDERVSELAKKTPGVPPGVIRGLIENRAPGCPCLQAIEAEKA